MQVEYDGHAGLRLGADNDTCTSVQIITVRLHPGNYDLRALVLDHPRSKYCHVSLSCSCLSKNTVLKLGPGVKELLIAPCITPG